MAPNKKYLSLEDAADQLGLKPEELIRLREKGDVRGFADRGTWKFKADDIAEYHRSQQPDSEPDIPILDDASGEDESDYRSKVIRHGLDTNSDSDVRLIQSDESKQKRLTGSSGELASIDYQKSDSDIRLVEDPKTSKHKLSSTGSDSDVKIVKPKADAKSDSDSDVKMISKTVPARKTDSDVQLLEPAAPLVDSDSDVKTSDSDSDVRMAHSDSDVRLAPRPADSDSDVKLLARDQRSRESDELPLMPMDFDHDEGATFTLAPVDSTIKLASDSGVKRGSDVKRDSGIKLVGDSGIRLAGDSGIRLAVDSGIQLPDDSGVQLIQPADSGISLEGMDSGVRFPDSGITLGGDSGIRLGGSSGSNVKGGSGKKSKGDSDRIAKGSSRVSEDEINATAPMLLAELDESGDGSGEFSASDTSEMQSLEESGQNIVLFEDDEDEAPPAKKRRAKETADDSLFGDADDAVEELEVSDEDLTDDNEFGGLDFDADDGNLDDSFSEGESQHEILMPKKMAVAKEVEWGAGFCGLLLLSLCILIVGAIVSADLLRNVWAGGADSSIDPGIASLAAGIWK